MLITLWPPLWCLGGRDSDSDYENPYVLGTIAPYHHRPSSTNQQFWTLLTWREWHERYTLASAESYGAQIPHVSTIHAVQCAKPTGDCFSSRFAIPVSYITVHLQRVDCTCHVDMCEDCYSFTSHMQRVPPLHTVTLGDICLSWSQNMISSCPTGKKQLIGQISAVCASAPKNVIFFLHGWKRSFFRPLSHTELLL